MPISKRFALSHLSPPLPRALFHPSNSQTRRKTLKLIIPFLQIKTQPAQYHRDYRPRCPDRHPHTPASVPAQPRLRGAKERGGCRD